MLFYKEKKKAFSDKNVRNKTNIYFEIINESYREKYCNTTIYCCKNRFYEITYNQHNN